jgi:hypothetical protein
MFRTVSHHILLMYVAEGKENMANGFGAACAGKAVNAYLGFRPEHVPSPTWSLSEANF